MTATRLCMKVLVVHFFVYVDKLTVTHVHHHFGFCNFFRINIEKLDLQLRNFFLRSFKPQNRPVSHILQEKKNLIRYTFKPSLAKKKVAILTGGK